MAKDFLDDLIGQESEAVDPARCIVVTPPCDSAELEARARALESDCWYVGGIGLPTPFYDENGALEPLHKEQIEHLATLGMTEAGWRELVGETLEAKS